MGGRGGSSGLSGKKTIGEKILPFEMPTIRGSEKQIKYVTDLFEQDRSFILREIEKNREAYEAGVAIASSQAYVEVYTHALNNQSKALKGQTYSARVVLDNRGKFFVSQNIQFERLYHAVSDKRSSELKKKR